MIFVRLNTIFFMILKIYFQSEEFSLNPLIYSIIEQAFLTEKFFPFFSIINTLCSAFSSFRLFFKVNISFLNMFENNELIFMFQT